MSKKKLAAIIIPCAIAVVAAIVIANPWQPAPVAQTCTLATRVNPSGAGSVSPSGVEWQSGLQLNLRATPASGYRFVNWTGDVDTVGNVEDATTTITMNGNYSITANFAREVVEIRNWYDLDAVRHNLAGSYVLMNDLDSTTAGYAELASGAANGGKGWEPIGAPDQGFTGSFDGQGYEIRDMFINRPDQDYVGLFARISWTHPVESVGTVENIGLVDANVTGHWQVGALVGRHAGDVENSYCICNVTGSGLYVGGLVGYSDGGVVSNSHSAGGVTGIRYVGGLVGHITGSLAVRQGTVANCYSTCTVTGGTRIGGLVGGTLAAASVSNSYFAGSVTGNRWVGGLVAENGACNVSNSYSTGDVTGGGYTGGLVGLNYHGPISHCYSAGVVHAEQPAGGLVGYNEDGTVIGSFWDRQASGQGASDGGTGKTMIEMSSTATFSGAGWNITAVASPDMRNPSYIWNIVDGLTYPFLSWQSVA